MRFGGFKRGARIKANRSYACRQCDMEWAAIPPEKTVNKKGKLVVTAAAREKAKTCPSCGAGNARLLASGKEAARYRELKRAEAAGIISDLTTQPVFKLVEGLEYRADFAYKDPDGKQIYEDCKGMITEKFQIKMKLMKHFYPSITVHLT